MVERVNGTIVICSEDSLSHFCEGEISTERTRYSFTGTTSLSLMAFSRADVPCACRRLGSARPPAWALQCFVKAHLSFSQGARTFLFAGERENRPRADKDAGAPTFGPACSVQEIATGPLCPLCHAPRVSD